METKTIIPEFANEATGTAEYRLDLAQKLKADPKEQDCEHHSQKLE